MTSILTADKNFYKPIGRTCFYNDTLWLALSGTGISFSFTGKDLSVVILGDDRVLSTEETVQIEKARIAVYVDGKRILEDMVTVSEKTYSIIHTDYVQTHQVQIIKLSEAPMSIVGIRQLITDEESTLLPTPEKKKKLEFIGDSITCGYGVDDDNPEHPFSTATEDVTKAYAYQTAQLLNADYSMVSYSGYGIYSGYTEGERSTSELVPPFYTKIGFSRGTIDGQSITMTDWNFHTYRPDVVVLNLGTNDDSYCQDFPERQEEFTRLYTQFLQLIRKHNPDAHILCTYGMMNQRLMPYIKKATDSYQAECKDENISFFPLALQSESDGYGADYHPSIITHTKTAKVLAEKIREIMKWE
ncbi:MAG: GDSL-type esterase/lipase family protein [Lachnospiraceae bacterium]|nr:GDSL-type esterase/lipase family protein [Lachnospiraceae bacterium]